MLNKLLSAAVISFALLSTIVQATPRAEQGWQLIEQGALLVDVRTPQEFEQGHLKNALNYPLSDLDKHFANINKNTLIVLYCRSGNRSGQAYDYLTKQGFTNLYNAGGYQEMLSSEE
ncbi:rhodanese-like domain-containing protein [Vibrio sp. LaRot3]|uniref:rhodanese-like domain-containing protein n=1 Tax=Vibrio sp. LaRot3 TaxID=2998829 RepID=UPI0022CDD902|nr:rhodanese-like domain-containing protein [Vibrio sp. LaRot3]MDA0147409.1 rhodanese-like domain-containing protein [Vibrio sp. LaRot3]